ncbi:MAG: ABC transporter permease subunit [Cyanobacteriota bacterium]|jgi:spermidine/putrescine transport system permease protein|nr:ABC transporter permease subunit [Cyanobacteriota bacterium]
MSATAGPTGRIGSSLLLLWSLLAYGLLYAPIAVMALFSFNAPRGRFNLLWQGFTLANWRHPLKDAALTQAFLTSLALALAAALLAVLLGGLMALGLSRARRRGLRWIELLLALPLTHPEIVLAVALLHLFVAVDLPRGPVTLVLAHSLFCLSYAALTLKARLAGFDPTLELAAHDLGAPPLQAFLRVTLPQLAPGLLAAALLCFSLSFDDYVITGFTAGEVVTLPLYLAGAIQREIAPQIQVLSTMVLLVSALLLALASGRWGDDHG